MASPQLCRGRPSRPRTPARLQVHVLLLKHAPAPVSQPAWPAAPPCPSAPASPSLLAPECPPHTRAAQSRGAAYAVPSLSWDAAGKGRSGCTWCDRSGLTRVSRSGHGWAGGSSRERGAASGPARLSRSSGRRPAWTHGGPRCGAAPGRGGTARPGRSECRGKQGGREGASGTALSPGGSLPTATGVPCCRGLAAPSFPHLASHRAVPPAPPSAITPFSAFLVSSSSACWPRDLHEARGSLLWNPRVSPPVGCPVAVLPSRQTPALCPAPTPPQAGPVTRPQARLLTDPRPRWGSLWLR